MPVTSGTVACQPQASIINIGHGKRLIVHPDLVVGYLMALQKGAYCVRTINFGGICLRSLPGRRRTHGVDDDPKASGLQALQGFFGSGNGLTKGGITMLADRPV